MGKTLIKLNCNSLALSKILNFFKNYILICPSILVFYLLTINYTSGKDIYSCLSFQRQIILDSSAHSPRMFICKIDSGIINILDNTQRKKSDSIFIKFHRYYDNNKLEFNIHLNGNLPLKKLFFNDFIALGDSLFLLDFQHLMIFQLKDSNYYMLKSIKLSETIQKIYLYKNSIYGISSIIAGTNINDSTHTYIMKYNIPKEQIEFEAMNDPAGIEWTLFQPRYIFDFIDGTFIFSNATDYKIYFYNPNYQIKDSIVYKPDKWLVHNMNTEISSHRNYGKTQIKDMMPVYNQISLINSVNYVTNDKILVAWSIPDQSGKKNFQLFFDIWEKRNNSWIKIAADLNNHNKEKLFHPDIITLTNKFNISNGKITNIVPIPFYIDDTHNNFIYSSFEEHCDDFILKNDLTYSLIIRTFK